MSDYLKKKMTPADEASRDCGCGLGQACVKNVRAHSAPHEFVRAVQDSEESYRRRHAQTLAEVRDLLADDGIDPDGERLVPWPSNFAELAAHAAHTFAPEQPLTRASPVATVPPGPKSSPGGIPS